MVGMVGYRIHVMVNQKGESTRRRIEASRGREGCDLKSYMNKSFSSSHLKQYIETNTNFGTLRIRGQQRWPLEIT